MKATRSIACLLLAALPTLASAHVAEKVETLHDQALAEIPGHRGLMLTVSFKPGQVSAPHVHPGSVFVYVLEGTVQTQLEGGPVETYTVGQSWYEPANVPHLLARNPDPMKPAKLLVWELLKEGDPILKPLERGAH
ncbi:cupin domain-containing protein [Pseudomonas aeruginosa]|uniref:cupin domain-containing protein n=1 Tax=Pseudomonas aeruginosa TaxID=287 RepID=UPI000803719D|nr:cupin domain-containing protein [Pseudomonas aeruginosa]OBY20041.1 cupin [Pseudomonas aeruginosa]HBO1236290.1 cupin domain-containing protein [Pseudomonas aeruginosa]